MSGDPVFVNANLLLEASNNVLYWQASILVCVVIAAMFVPDDCAAFNGVVDGVNAPVYTATLAYLKFDIYPDQGAFGPYVVFPIT